MFDSKKRQDLNNSYNKFSSACREGKGVTFLREEGPFPRVFYEALHSVQDLAIVKYSERNNTEPWNSLVSRCLSTNRVEMRRSLVSSAVSLFISIMGSSSPLSHGRNALVESKLTPAISDCSRDISLGFLLNGSKRNIHLD